MSGHKREKRIGGLAVLALLLLTFTICTTGALRAKADELKPGEFAGVVTPQPIMVTCAPGATTGTGEMQVKVTRGPRTPNSFRTGNAVKPLTASWPGGGSLTINKFDQFFRTGPGAKFPCPAGPITIQPASFNSGASNLAAPTRTFLPQVQGRCPAGQYESSVTFGTLQIPICLQVVVIISQG